jgi:hypothetical protein
MNFRDEANIKSAAEESGDGPLHCLVNCGGMVIESSGKGERLTSGDYRRYQAYASALVRAHFGILDRKTDGDGCGDMHPSPSHASNADGHQGAIFDNEILLPESGEGQGKGCEHLCRLRLHFECVRFHGLCD